MEQSKEVETKQSFQKNQETQQNSEQNSAPILTNNAMAESNPSQGKQRKDKHPMPFKELAKAINVIFDLTETKSNVLTLKFLQEG